MSFKPRTVLALVCTVFALGATVALPSMAGAGDNSGAYVGTTPPTVQGTTLERPVAEPATASKAPATVEATSLALTGGDVAGLVAVGGVAVVLGGGLLVLRRRTAIDH